MFMESSIPLEVSLEKYFEGRNTFVSSWKRPLLSDEQVLELGNTCKDVMAQRDVREIIVEAAMSSFLVYKKKWMETKQDKELRVRFKHHLQTMKVVNERCKWYCPVETKESTVSRKVCGFQVFFVFVSHHCCCDHTQKRIIIAFRGTQNVFDVLSDISCAPGQLEGVKNGNVHFGFAQVANQIDVDAIIALAADHDIVLTGHSMGGAVAILVALRVIARLEVIGRSFASIWDDFREQDGAKSSLDSCMHFGVVTLGSPPPICFAMATSILEKKRLILNVVDESDRVPFLFALVPCLPTIVCCADFILPQ